MKRKSIYGNCLESVRLLKEHQGTYRIHLGAAFRKRKAVYPRYGFERAVVKWRNKVVPRDQRPYRDVFFIVKEGEYVR